MGAKSALNKLITGYIRFHKKHLVTSALHMEFKGKNEVEDYGDDFDGVFRFTNPTDEDFKTLWNNKEYTYPAGKTVPMVIANSSLEEIQQIRKYFAKRLAEREYLKSKDFKKIANGLKDPSFGRNVIQSAYEETNLQPWIDACLNPMPEGRATVNKIPEAQLNVIAKPVGKGSSDGKEYPAVDLNDMFKEENEKLLAKRAQ